jgi:hypothetical protein
MSQKAVGLPFVAIMAELLGILGILSGCSTPPPAPNSQAGSGGDVVHETVATLAAPDHSTHDAYGYIVIHGPNTYRVCSCVGDAVGLGYAAIPELIRLLGNRDAKVRERAISALEEITRTQYYDYPIMDPGEEIPLSTLDQSIAQWCKWYGIEVPAIK